MALGTTEPVTDMINRSNSWEEGRGAGCRCVGLTTMQTSRVDCLEPLEASTSWIPKGPVQACIGTTLNTLLSN